MKQGFLIRPIRSCFIVEIILLLPLAFLLRELKDKQREEKNTVAWRRASKTRGIRPQEEGMKQSLLIRLHSFLFKS
jgi:hypothetical protein